jgi:hypothetical protein
MHADFAHNTQTIPDLVRRIESGADVVVAQAKLEGEPERSQYWIRRYAPLLLRGVVSVPGVVDLVSGFAIIRLVALRNAIRSQPGRLLVTEGWAANAELYWRAARYARRIEAVTSVERHDLRSRPSRVRPWETAAHIWGSRRALRESPLPPSAPEPANRREETQPEVVS